MITYYAKASDGSYAECRFKNMDYATLGWISICESTWEDGIKYKMITKNEFDKATLKKKRYGRFYLTEPTQNKPAGYFIEYL